MAYVELKTIKGKEYKYLRRSIREGTKVKHVTVKYLGPANPIYKVGKKRKTNSSLYARETSEEEKAALQTATKSNSAFTKDRAKIVLLSSQKMFAKKISERLSCDVRKVRKAIHDFNRKGLKALERGKAKGAVPKFTEAVRKAVLEHFSKKPSEFGLHFTTWTLPRFRKHLVDSSVVGSISVESLRQILMKAGAKLKRSKRWQYSPDKDFHKKNLR